MMPAQVWRDDKKQTVTTLPHSKSTTMTGYGLPNAI
jgi:hypothetical protein